MTKRILSFVIVLAMLVSVLPVHMVSAEQAATQTVATHGHSDAHKCSEQCAGGTITWTPWGVTNGSADTFPTISGHYYLECDLSLTARNDIPAGADVTICLNGWNITETGSGNVSYVAGVLNCCTYVGSALSTYGIALISESLGWSTTVLVWTFIAAAGGVLCLCCIKKWRSRMS